MSIIRPLPSSINPKSESFQENRKDMLEALDQLAAKLKESRFQGKAKHLEKAKAAGKFTARERIELCLDQDSPFLELLPLAGLGGKGFGTGGTTVGGIGLVAGKLCLLIANVGTHKGGAVDYATLQKSLRFGEIALKNKLPVINLVESAGANLPEQARIFNHGGATFREITRRSKLGLVTISVVFGNSTAGGAYVPGMSDYAIFVKNNAKVFLAGPPLVKMATNEIVDDESLGGAGMHSSISGVSDYLAEDERDAIRLAREIMEHIPEPESAPIEEPIEEPLYPQEEILGILPSKLKKPLDVLELIARIIDGSRFHHFKPDYGSTLVCGFARIHGHRMGILANQGVLFSEAANKGAHFIQLCNQQGIPLLFLQNITGFMVGRQYEEEGIIKHGAKLINAVSNSTVPAITIMIGASYGAGNYAMMGRAFEPNFLFAYPNAKIAVMGSEQLSGVMESIQRESMLKAGLPIDEEQSRMMREHLVKEVEKESNAWYASGQSWDDGIIDPRDTRTVLGICLSVIHQHKIEKNNQFGVFRM